MEQDPKKYNPPEMLNPNIGFNGLINAHRLGMSWGKIALVVGAVVAVFIGYTFLMSRQSQKNVDEINIQIQKATQDATQRQLQMQADIQRQVDEQIKKAGAQQ